SLAAFAQDWRIRVWDAKTGMLHLMLDPPHGYFPDNSMLAFSLDGRRLTFASGEAATLWDLETGRRLPARSFPPGVDHAPGFQPSGRLISVRVETKPGTRGPFRDVPYEQFPRAVRIRELLDSGQTRTLAEIDRFNRFVFFAVAPDDMSYLAVDGMTIDATGT